MNPWSLDYWQSGEYQVAREKLDDEEKAGFTVNPPRKSMFEALRRVPQRDVRVAIIGQDPYPDSRMATGMAFSIPHEFGSREFPATLRSIFAEYVSDLGYNSPNHGDLSKWAAQGVLLWNAIPSCRAGVSLSHDWPGQEWSYLTREIVRRLSTQGVVFAFLGSVARRYTKDVEPSHGAVILETSHPSPRGNLNSRNPFRGSRLFSTINAKLVENGIEPIDWRIDDKIPDAPPPEVSRVLPNLGPVLPLPEKTSVKYADSTFEL